MTDASDADHKVGYKRPPLHSRFQPGVSGNPRGRRKGVRNFASDVKRALEIPVSLKDSGKTRRVSTQEALILRQRDKALKGDARALDSLLALARIHNVDGAPSGEQRPLAHEDQAILDAYLEDAIARRVLARDDARNERKGEGYKDGEGPK